MSQAHERVPSDEAPGPLSPGAPAPVRLSGGETVLFLVHDDAGSVAYAGALAPHLGPAVSVVALPGIAAGEPGLRTLEAMARRIVRMIRDVQPSGPYRIAGWSAGGLIAYEAASLLLGHDEEVAFVGLLDPGDTADDGGGAYREAARQYLPQPLPVPVHVLAAGDPAGVRHCWQARLPRTPVEAVAVDGSLAGEAGAAALGRALAPGRPARSGAAPGEDAYAPLVPLKFNRTASAALFCFPGAGASVSSFAELSGSLAPGWRVYGLEPRGLDGALVPHATVEAAAAFHLAQIREAEPTGPVHLLGHSFGGWVAFEIARRLHDAGRPAASLTLLDTSPPDDEARPAEFDSDEALRVFVEVMELSAERSLEIDWAELAALEHEARLAQLHARLVRFGLATPRSRPEVLQGPFRAFAACLRTPYAPGAAYPDPARLVLVRDLRLDESQNQRRFVDRVHRWKRWMPRLRATLGAGNHVTALKRPHVAQLAELLRAEG